MNSTRVIASLLTAMILWGSLPAVALAQEPAPTSSVLTPYLHSVGAGVFTVARIPFEVGLCGAGAVTGILLFLVTLGSAYRATTRVLEEGCAGQKWSVRSDDLRPSRPSPGIFESRMDRYQER
jgi:hypothetical protein